MRAGITDNHLVGEGAATCRGAARRHTGDAPAGAGAGAEPSRTGPEPEPEGGAPSADVRSSSRPHRQAMPSRWRGWLRPATSSSVVSHVTMCSTGPSGSAASSSLEMFPGAGPSPGRSTHPVAASSGRWPPHSSDAPDRRTAVEGAVRNAAWAGGGPASRRPGARADHGIGDRHMHRQDGRGQRPAELCYAGRVRDPPGEPGCPRNSRRRFPTIATLPPCGERAVRPRSGGRRRG
jgi:hypothetical protein